MQRTGLLKPLRPLLAQSQSVFAARAITKGLLSHLPGVKLFWGGGGTSSASYCYTVFLRHLVSIAQRNLPTTFHTVAEMGPGNSLGIGLMSLLTGAQRYFALDMVRYSEVESTLQVFDELIDMLRNRRDIPGPDEQPDVKPHLDDYRFPSHILTDARLDSALAPSRLDALRQAICTLGDDVALDDPDAITIRYLVPWHDASYLGTVAVDLLLSSAVMEHVTNLELTYQAFAQLMAPGGIMSHQIDFRSHGTAREWNGHWRYSDTVWHLIEGNHPYTINREPCSTHLQLNEENGFDIKQVIRTITPNALSHTQLAPAFQSLDAHDLTTSSALIQSQRRS